MHFKETDIPDIILIEPQVFADSRGFFMETYQQEKYASEGISTRFVQDNHSRSIQGCLRGLHYQINYPQGKLIRCIVGEIFDVAVDIRRSSPTFGNWVGQILSADNKYQLWIPPGFAHGFLTLSPWAEILYKATDFYAPEFERCIIWNDPVLAIDWPIVNQITLELSEKDKNGVKFSDAETYL